MQLLLWDIDGTLLNFLKSEEHGIRSCFEKFHFGECTDEMIREYSGINLSYWQMLERGEIEKPVMLVRRFEDFFMRFGIDPSFAEAFNKEYQIRLGDTICFHENAWDTLWKIKLRGNILQCAVTNGTRVAQSRKLEKSGLNNIFDATFISEDIGAEKPSKAFFDAVFKKLGDFPPSEVMIIGDSLTSDILGGINAGITTCWYNPDKKEADPKIMPHHTITDLYEVLELI